MKLRVISPYRDPEHNVDELRPDNPLAIFWKLFGENFTTGENNLASVTLRSDDGTEIIYEKVND